MPAPLPIDDVLPQLLAVLETRSSAVLVAPPGAGKTTRVPLALLEAQWRQGRKIILLSPRRLAARAAAHRMADMLGEPVGKTVGYRMRLESKISAATKIEVITEALLTRQILAQPDLPDVAAILFDEFHERSLDGDTGLALALDVQANLRADLRLLPMSATLDGARVADLLDHAPVIDSKGRMFDVSLRYLGRDGRAPLEPQIVSAIRQALRTERGSILVFLPGAAEINRVKRLLDDDQLPEAVTVHPLMGQLELKAQQAAIAPAPAGQRKIVLATSLAETSLTIDGVRVVIDSGLSRRPKFDPGSGMTRLVTERVSLASATQRAGRAGRLEPGVCLRLWDEPENRGLVPFDPPEIKAVDVTQLVLTLAAWGTTSPDGLRWLDPPPQGAWAQAVKLLQQLDALDQHKKITDHGRKLSALPVHPRLAHMMVEASSRKLGGVACFIAAILSEQGAGGRSVDLRVRLDGLREEKSARAETIRRLASGWATSVGASLQDGTVADAARLLALAFPDRIAKARGTAGNFQLASGQSAYLDPAEPLSRAPWLVVAELSGTAERARILLAAEIAEADMLDVVAAHMTTDRIVRIEGKSNRTEVVEITQLGAITFSEKRIENPAPDIVHQALVGFVRKQGLAVLPWTDDLKNWQQRLQFLHARAPQQWPDVSDAALMAALDQWLSPYLLGKQRLSDLSSAELGHALHTLVPHHLLREMERLAPARLTTAAGSSHAIDYAAQGGPAVAARVQEFFGWNAHPVVAEAVPLTLILLSPAHRPIQTTQDLPGFWKGSWAAVKADMKGRYPKHVWPDDPASAQATTRAKPRAG